YRLGRYRLQGWLRIYWLTMTTVVGEQCQEAKAEEVPIDLHCLQDPYWEELLMLLVGCDWDTDGEAEQICGAVFQPRSRGHKMAVWISKGDDEETIIQIGRKIKERLHFPDKIFFHTVEDQKALVRGKDITTGRYVL
ncbi:translation initiation factor 4E, partial [Paragonimus westermani]